MHRFWGSVIQPLLEHLHPKDIVEVGAEDGYHTRKILAYCLENEVCLHVVEPFPKYDVAAFLAEFGDAFIQYSDLSLQALPLIPRMDVVLLDGDHNWYTVYNELKIVEHVCDRRGDAFPFVLLHDVDWPYARRDLYYNPEGIPEEFRRPFKKAGMLPGQSELVEGKGLNRAYNNAIEEGAPRNGVLTAAEDFQRQSPKRLALVVIPAMMGLGMLYDEDALEKFPGAARFIEALKTPGVQQELLKVVDKERVRMVLSLEDKRFDVKWLQGKIEIAKAKELQHVAERESLSNQCESLSRKLEELQLEYSKRRNSCVVEQLSMCNSDLCEAFERRERCAEHIRELIRFIEEMRALSYSLLVSKRWRIGSRLVRCVEMAMFQPSRSQSPKYLARVFEQYAGWKIVYQKAEKMRTSRSALDKHNSVSDQSSFDEGIAYKRDILEKVNGEIRQLMADISSVDGMIEDTKGWLDNIIRSYRFRAGHFVINQLDRLTPWPHPAWELYALERLVKEWQHWERVYKPAKAGQSPRIPGVDCKLPEGVYLDDSILLRKNKSSSISMAAFGAGALSLNVVTPPRGLRIIQFTPGNPRNPYYTMVLRHLAAHGWGVDFITDRHALLEAVQGASSPPIVLFHQLEPLYRAKSGNVEETVENARKLMDYLEALKHAGAKVVWTKHNPAPHDQQFSAVDEEVSRCILEIADKVVVHGGLAKRILSKQTAREKIEFVMHPSYAGYYGPRIDRKTARERLGLDPDAFIFGNVGELKPYKGLEFIIEAFNGLTAIGGAKKPKLLLVGNPGPKAYVDGINALASEDIMVRAEDVPDKDMPLWLGAMDACVFAFRDIWCSGSVILSLSYEVPAVVPAIGCLDDYVHEENTGFLYKHNDLEDLRRAMNMVQHTPLMPHLKYMCGKFNIDYAVERVAEQYASLYKEICGD